ncbi:MAG: hypothetical protein WBB19_05085 [Desulforhopalus sp.]
MDFDRDYANYVSDKGVAEIQALEKETGKRIMAYPTPPEPAALSPEMKAKIEALEKKLCVRLVAYENN